MMDGSMMVDIILNLINEQLFHTFDILICDFPLWIMGVFKCFAKKPTTDFTFCFELEEKINELVHIIFPSNLPVV